GPGEIFSNKPEIINNIRFSIPNTSNSLMKPASSIQHFMQQEYSRQEHLNKRKQSKVCPLLQLLPTPRLRYASGNFSRRFHRSGFDFTLEGF
ncbi:MAG: hypothetical protein KKF22_14730, partial [Gammaproteobacteria bacterium]|nr:hypothetical protein [Gammaproteobacteria bacterium]